MNTTFLMLTRRNVISTSVTNGNTSVGRKLMLGRKKCIRLRVKGSYLTSTALIPLPEDIGPFFATDLLDLCRFVIDAVDSAGV